MRQTEGLKRIIKMHNIAYTKSITRWKICLQTHFNSKQSVIYIGAVCFLTKRLRPVNIAT